MNVHQPVSILSSLHFLPRLPRGEVQHAMHAIGDAAHSIAHKIRDDVHLADVQKTAGELDEEKWREFHGNIYRARPPPKKKKYI